MYQQRRESDSASLEGMEEVFSQKPAPLPAVVTLDDFNQLPVALAQTSPSPQTGKRIWRGTYNKGLLLLREETLRPLRSSPEHVFERSPRIFFSKDIADDSLSYFEHGLNTEDIHHESFSEADFEILELIKAQAEQARVSNELIKHLTEQLQQQDKYIKQLLSAKERPGVLAGIRQLIWGRR